MFLRFTKNDILIIVALSLPLFLFGILSTMVIPIFPSLIEEYFNSSTDKRNSNFNFPKNDTKYNFYKLSVLYGTRNLCQIIISPIFGYFVDYFGSWLILSCGIIFQVITVLVYGLGNGYYVLIIGRVFEGISVVAVNCAGMALIALQFKDQRQQGFVYGTRVMGMFIGFALGPAYSGPMYQYYGKSMTFLSLLSLNILEIVLVVMVFKSFADVWKQTGKVNSGLSEMASLPLSIEDRKLTNATPNLNGQMDKEMSTESRHNVLMFFQDPFFLISLGALPVIIINIFLLFSSLPRYMKLRFNSSESEQGLIWIINLIGYSLGFISSQIINTKFSTYRHIFLMIYTWLHMLATVTIPLMPIWWTVSIPLCVVAHVHMIIESVLSPIFVTIVKSRHFSKFGSMSGIIMMSVAVTGFLGSFLGPILLHKIGFGYMNLGLGVVNLFYGPLFLFLRRFCQ